MIHWCYEEIKTMDTKVKRIFNGFLGLPSGSWVEAENCPQVWPCSRKFWYGCVLCTKRAKRAARSWRLTLHDWRRATSRIFQDWLKASPDTGLLDSTSCFRSKWSAWTYNLLLTAPLRQWQRRCVVDNIDMKTMDAKSGFWKNIQSQAPVQVIWVLIPLIHQLYIDIDIMIFQYLGSILGHPLLSAGLRTTIFKMRFYCIFKKNHHLKMVPTSARLFQNP